MLRFCFLYVDLSSSSSGLEFVSTPFGVLRFLVFVFVFRISSRPVAWVIFVLCCTRSFPSILSSIYLSIYSCFKHAHNEKKGKKRELDASLFFRRRGPREERESRELCLSSTAHHPSSFDSKLPRSSHSPLEDVYPSLFPYERSLLFLFQPSLASNSNRRRGRKGWIRPSSFLSRSSRRDDGGDFHFSTPSWLSTFRKQRCGGG